MARPIARPGPVCAGPDIPTPTCAELERLAGQVAQLSPSHRDPERFHMDRNEIVAELRRLARTLGRAA